MATLQEIKNQIEQLERQLSDITSMKSALKQKEVVHRSFEPDDEQKRKAILMKNFGATSVSSTVRVPKVERSTSINPYRWDRKAQAKVAETSTGLLAPRGMLQHVLIRLVENFGFNPSEVNGLSRFFGSKETYQLAVAKRHATKKSNGQPFHGENWYMSRVGMVDAWIDNNLSMISKLIRG